MYRFKIYYYIILLIVFIPQLIFSQVKGECEYISPNHNAQYYFIEGKILELQGRYPEAIECYRTALIYDRAGGIYFAIGELLYKRGHYKEALIETNNALKISSNNKKYKELKGDIYIALNDWYNASQEYEDIISIDSTDATALYTLARIYQELRMPSRAIVIYENISENIGFDYDVLKRMYDIYYSYKDYEKCIDVLNRALRLDPFDAINYKLLGSLYEKLYRYEQAEKIYEELYKLNPQDKNIQAELIRIYFKGNNTEKAFENYAKLLGKELLSYEEKMQIAEMYYNIASQDKSYIEIAKTIFENISRTYPDRWLPYYYLGAIDVFEKDFSSYEYKLDRAITLGDTVKDAYVMTGFLYFNQGKYEKTEKIITRGIELFPDDFRLNYIFGLVLQRTRREAEAIKYFEKALEISPSDISILSTLALAYHGQGLYNESEETYEKALIIDPENALILNNYAYNLAVRGVKLEKALEMSRKAVNKDPESPSYLDTYGWVHYKLGNYKEARTYIEKAVSINSNSAVISDHLGDVYNALNDIKNAVKYWKKALELNPENQEIKKKIEINTKNS